VVFLQLIEEMDTEVATSTAMIVFKRKGYKGENVAHAQPSSCCPTI